MDIEQGIPVPETWRNKKGDQVHWLKVNDEPFEYAIQQGPHGDEFVKLLNGECLRRPLQSSSAGNGDDPADLWDRYCAETPRKMRSPQGAMAFAFGVLTATEPQPAQVSELADVAEAHFLPEIAALRAALETAAGRFNMMAGVGLVNGADPKVGYRECMAALALSRPHGGGK